MKRVSCVLAALGALLVTTSASANVSKGKVIVGRLSKPASCFVQVDLETVEQNMFNGQETLKAGETELGKFASLQPDTNSLKPGDSVLFGSPAFKSEVGLDPDIALTDGQCEGLVPSTVLSFLGSFGPEAGTLTLPNEFSELSVVGELLLIDLELKEYQVKSLKGQKTIGMTADGSSSSSGGSSSGSTSSSGGSSGETSSGAPLDSSAPSSSSDSGGCHVAAPGTSGAHAGLLVALGALGLAVSARRKRR